MTSTPVTSHPPGDTAPRPTPGRAAGLSEFGVAALMAVFGIVVLVEASQISRAAARVGTIGPKDMPYLVGGLLLVTSALLAVDIARGGRGAKEEGEDVDPSMGTDWVTLFSLVVLFAAVGELIPVIGFPASGMLLFFGVARLLGSRRLWLDIVVSVALPLVAFLLFTRGLGVYLPSGLS